jgi:hypothetical protein
MGPESLTALLTFLGMNGGQVQQGQQPPQNAGQIGQGSLQAILPHLLQALMPQQPQGQGQPGPQMPQGQPQQGQPQGQPGQEQGQQGSQQVSPMDIMKLLQHFGIGLK